MVSIWVFWCFGNICLGYYTLSGSLELTVISVWNGLSDISAPNLIRTRVLCKYREYIYIFFCKLQLKEWRKELIFFLLFSLFAILLRKPPWCFWEGGGEHRSAGPARGRGQLGRAAGRSVTLVSRAGRFWHPALRRPVPCLVPPIRFERRGELNAAWKHRATEKLPHGINKRCRSWLLPISILMLKP